MKGFIFTIILFSIMIAAILANVLFVKSITNQMTETIKSLNPIPCEDNNAILNEFDKLWKKRSIWLSLSVTYEDIQELTDTLDALITANTNENPNQFKIYTELLLNSIDEIGRLEKLSAKNIL